MAKTRAQTNRAIRQEALREQLSQQGHVQHVVENLKKIEELVIESDDDGNNSVKVKFELDKLKVANEQRFKLIAKYLPDIKQTELVGEGGGEISTSASINFIPVCNDK